MKKISNLYAGISLAIVAALGIYHTLIGVTLAYKAVAFFMLTIPPLLGSINCFKALSKS